MLRRDTHVALEEGRSTLTLEEEPPALRRSYLSVLRRGSLSLAMEEALACAV